MPSLIEGFGLPALESLLCGTPVIYWEGCLPVRETVGGRGYAVQTSSNVLEWAEAMSSALDARRQVDPPVDRYDWSRTVSTIEDTLRKAGA